MIPSFRQERDGQGREVLEIGMNERLFQAIAGGLPLVGLVVVYFAFANTPRGVPWHIMAVPVALAAIFFAFATWMSRRSKVRVTIDGGKFLVGTSAGVSEVRMADVAKAEFGSDVVDSSSGTTRVYRLEFVMKNGERVPATNAYFGNAYSASGQERMTAAISAALGKQMV